MKLELASKAEVGFGLWKGAAAVAGLGLTGKKCLELIGMRVLQLRAQPRVPWTSYQDNYHSCYGQVSQQSPTMILRYRWRTSQHNLADALSFRPLRCFVDELGEALFFPTIKYLQRHCQDTLTNTLHVLSHSDRSLLAMHMTAAAQVCRHRKHLKAASACLSPLKAATTVHGVVAVSFCRD